MKALVVVDYQNDFVDGKLGFAGAEKIEDNILKLIQDFRKNNDLVMFTMDTHFDDYMSTVEGNHLPVPHCLKGSEGHRLRKRIEEVSNDSLIFEKHTFPSLELANKLQELNPNEIHLCGLVSDICVFANAVMAKAACPNSEIYIHKSASDSYDKEMEKKTYEVASHLHINII